MIQQGQVIELKAKRADGQRLWKYRCGLEGRGSGEAAGRRVEREFGRPRRK